MDSPMLFNRLVYLLLLLMFSLSLQIILDLEIGEPCQMSSGRKGVCRPAKECGNASYLKQLDICMFDNMSPIVCCPRHSKANETCEKRCKGYVRRRKRQGIVRGTEVMFYEIMPYMAVIGYGEGLEDIEWNCGGTLISERFILSAAHCANSSMIYFQWAPDVGKIGVLDITTKPGNGDYEIVERTVHPDYREPALYHDIALFKLKESSLPSVTRPVCLYDSEMPQRNGTVSGWGRTSVAGPQSVVLLEADLEIFSDDECLSMLADMKTNRAPQGFNKTTMVCAGDRKEGKDTCTGDSGGPLLLTPENKYVCRHYQIGITSFGKGCGRPDSPGVYTRISYYIPWIESIVWP